MTLSWSESASITHTHRHLLTHTHTHTQTRHGEDGTGNPRTVTVPLPLGAPLGAPSRPYLLIVIINKGVIQYVLGRNPTSLLRTVTFPVHQVLKSSSPPPRVQNAIDRIGGFPIYESRRGRNRSRRIKGRPKNGFNFGYMERGMNSPVRRREFEADCHRTNNFSDRKRANKFGSQLITHGPERNVLGRKPHFLTNDVDGRLRPVAISLSLGARPHPEESLSGSRPGTVTPLDEGVSRGGRDFGFHTREKRWLVT